MLLKKVIFQPPYHLYFLVSIYSLLSSSHSLNIFLMNSCPTPHNLAPSAPICHWLSSILPYAHSSVTPLIFCFPPSIFLSHCVSTLFSPPSSLPSFSSLVKQVYSFFCHLKSFCGYPVSQICMKEVSAVSVAFSLTCRTYF